MSEALQQVTAFSIVFALMFVIVVALRLLTPSAIVGRLPVAPRHWSMIDFLAFYLLLIVLSNFVSAILAFTGFLSIVEPKQIFLTNTDVTVEGLGAVWGAPGAQEILVASRRSGQVLVLWSSLFSVPLVTLAAWSVLTFLRGAKLDDSRSLFLAEVRCALMAAFIVLPVVLMLNFVVTMAHQQLGGEPATHPMALLGAGKVWWRTLFYGVSVCVMIPWVEELLFRGMLLRWVMSSLGAALLLMALATFLALSPAFMWNPQMGPVAFIVAAWCVLLASERWAVKRRQRTLRGLIATSTLFAVAHAAVWPSPIPLFFLALALAWLTLRTGRIIAAVVLHGFFNLVAFVTLILQSYSH